MISGPAKDAKLEETINRNETKKSTSLKTFFSASIYSFGTLLGNHWSLEPKLQD